MHSKLYYYKCYSLKGIQHDLNRKKTLKEGMHVYMLEKAMASHSVLLPGNSMDGGAWWAVVHGVTKSRTQLNDFTFTFHLHALQKEMATHSSVLA